MLFMQFKTCMGGLSVMHREQLPKQGTLCYMSPVIHSVTIRVVDFADFVTGLAA
jgi:hypothetical protein